MARSIVGRESCASSSSENQRSVIEHPLAYFLGHVEHLLGGDETGEDRVDGDPV
jgi:hypothetical protein